MANIFLMLLTLLAVWLPGTTQRDWLEFLNVLAPQIYFYIYFIISSFFLEQERWRVFFSALLMLSALAVWLLSTPQGSWIAPSIALAFTCVYFIISSFFLEQNRWRLFFSFVLLILSAGVVGLLSTSRGGLVAPFIQDSFKSGIFGGAIYTGLTWIGYLLGDIMYRLIEREKVRRHPEEEVIQSFCYLLARIEEIKPDQWFQASHKAELDELLDWIAKCMEYDLPHKLVDKERETTTWFYKCMRGIAADLRKLRQYVLLPEQIHWDQLKKDIATRFIYAAEGNWGRFDQAEVPVVSKSRRLLRIARACTIGILLLLVTGGVIINPFNLNGSVRSYIMYFVIAVGVVYLLTWLDPKADFEKFKSAADIVSNIRGRP